MSPGTARTARICAEKDAGAVQRRLLHGHPGSGEGGEANVAMGVLKEHTPQAGAAVTTPLREIQNELWQRTPGGARGRPNDGPRDEQPQLDAELYRLLGRPASATAFGEPAPKRRRHVHFADDASGAATDNASGAATAMPAMSATARPAMPATASAVTVMPAMPVSANAVTGSAATATPVTASAETAMTETAMTETAMTGTAMPESAAASALPEPHFGHDDYDELRPRLTENETETARQLQILKRSVEVLLTSTTTYKSSLSSRNTRAFDKGGKPRKGTPIYVLSKLITLVNNKERRSRHQVLELLHDAVQNLKDKRTLNTWKTTAKGAKTHYSKLDEVQRKLSTANSQLTALLRAFVITP